MVTVDQQTGAYVIMSRYHSCLLPGFFITRISVLPPWQALLNSRTINLDRLNKPYAFESLRKLLPG